MIVKMSRIFIATQVGNKEKLLDILGKMNLMHLEPVKPEEAVADRRTLRAIEDLTTAIQILSPMKAVGTLPYQKPLNTAREVIALQKSISDKKIRLAELHNKIRQLEIWGNVRLNQLEALRESGFEIRFFLISHEHVEKVRGECAEVLAVLPGKRVLMGVIDRSGQIEMPEGAKSLNIPAQDRISVLAEAGKVDNELKQDQDRLLQLAASVDFLQKEKELLSQKIQYTKAKRSGISQGELFALQGWLPAEKADNLSLELENNFFPAAVRIQPAKADELPPTLIRYPSWVRPIKVLFDMTGTLPGYREMDLSAFFMLAVPLFAAMLIGDAGYGLLIFIAALIFYDKIVRISDRSRANIILIFGVVTLIWGILIANYFGVTPESMARAGGHVKLSGSDMIVDYDSLSHDQGFYGRIGWIMTQAGLLWREDPKASRFLIMKVSLMIGCFHLIIARLARFVALVPDRRALAEIGLIVIIADMLAVIWHLIFIGVEKIPAIIWWILGAGISMAAAFGKPHKNMVKRFLLGLSSTILPLLSTFTDTMSYIRLFAVGLSSNYISSAFNAMALQMAETVGWIGAVPILIFGHGLNIALATIAIFAHALRLNMLEFSNHAGVQWNGYAYRPFTIQQRTSLGDDSQ